MARKGRRRDPAERYALLPREVLKSDAYAAMPDYAVRVLVAVAGQYCGANNGQLSMTAADARTLGIHSAWKVAAGLRLLLSSGLVELTRPGKYSHGRGISALYALGWRQFDVSPDAFPPIVVAQPAPHAWARWERPADWKDFEKDTRRQARGRARHGRRRFLTILHVRNKTISTSGTRKRLSVSHVRNKNSASAVPDVGVTL